MSEVERATVEAVDDRAREDLLRVWGELPGATGSLSFHSWTPAGMRTIKRRRFTWLAVDDEPVLVAKSAIDSDDAKVAREWDILQGLSLAPGLRFAPAVARTDSGFVMRYGPSMDLPDALGADPARWRSLLERCVDDIAAMNLHDAARTTSAHDPIEVARHYVAEPDLGTAHLRRSLDEALLGPTHGDLSAWNIRYAPETERFTIIDWEDYRPVGIAGIDVLNLLLTLGIVAYPDHRDLGMDWLYDQVLESDHWYALMIRDLIVRYARAVGQPPRQIVDLLPFFCQWLPTRLRREGRDPSPLFYDTFRARYLDRAPRWIEELPSE